MCKSVPQMAVEVRRMSTSVGASRRASSTVSIFSVLSPRQTMAFISFPFFLQTVLPKLCCVLSSKYPTTNDGHRTPFSGSDIRVFCMVLGEQLLLFVHLRE